MDWFTDTVELGPQEAAFIAQGMRRVAQADGLIHEREMNLIAAFEADLGNVEVSGQPNLGAEVQLAYLRSLIMVALADGVISATEDDEIRSLANEAGIDASVVDQEILTVKRRFLDVFAGVNVFRDAAVRVAEDLGLSPAELDALRQEA